MLKNGSSIISRSLIYCLFSRVGLQNSSETCENILCKYFISASLWKQIILFCKSEISVHSGINLAWCLYNKILKKEWVSLARQKLGFFQNLIFKLRYFYPKSSLWRLFLEKIIINTNDPKIFFLNNKFIEFSFLSKTRKKTKNIWIKERYIVYRFDTKV